MKKKKGPASGPKTPPITMLAPPPSAHTICSNHVFKLSPDSNFSFVEVPLEKKKNVFGMFDCSICTGQGRLPANIRGHADIRQKRRGHGLV